MTVFSMTRRTVDSPVSTGFARVNDASVVPAPEME